MRKIFSGTKPHSKKHKKYQQASKIWLSQIPLQEEITLFDNLMYKNQQHNGMLEQLYCNMVMAIKNQHMRPHLIVHYKNIMSLEQGCRTKT